MRMILLFLCLALVSGCCIAHRASAEEIVAFARERQYAQGRDRAVANLLWYEGSEGGYDYFKYVHGMAAERCFEVPSGEVSVPTVFPRTSDASGWVQIPAIGEYRFWTSNGS